MSEFEHFTLDIPESFAGYRLDQAVAQLLPTVSRSKIQSWIKQQQVTLNGQLASTRQKLLGGEQIICHIPIEPVVETQAENIPLEVIYEDEHVAVINKPAGLVVHPGAGNWNGTLVNGLLYRWPEQALLDRAGVVHRLDKNTTGLMVVARSALAQVSLVEQLQRHAVEREYLAVASGLIRHSGTIHQPIGRHARDRLRMAVTPMGKTARTHYQVEEHFHAYTLLRCRLETGRTHQIRVHLAFLRHPLLGDATYGARLKLPARATPNETAILRAFQRQALHAARLSFAHPATGDISCFQANLPQDMEILINTLRR